MTYNKPPPPPLPKQPPPSLLFSSNHNTNTNKSVNNKITLSSMPKATSTPFNNAKRFSLVSTNRFGLSESLQLIDDNNNTSQQYKTKLIEKEDNTNKKVN